jgi:glyoxylase-like metal-dependent hydrolase (beta-lactamase superfamily II)
VRFACLCLWSISLFVAPFPADAQSGRGIVERVAQAMGGSKRVLGVKTIMLRGTGENYNLGQNLTPEADLPLYSVTSYVRVIDFRNSRWRQDQTREPKFPTSNTNPQRQRTGYDIVAYDITSDTSMRRLGQRPTLDRRAEILYHPIGFVQAALARGAKVEEEIARSPSLRRVHLDTGGERYTMTVDNRTNLPLSIERTIANTTLGDVVLANEFPRWYAAGDVRVPVEIVQRLDGRWKLADIQFDGVRVNGDIIDITIPESVRNAALVPTPVNVAVDSVSPGVWLLAGGSHNSVAIEMKDHLLLVEAPQSDERALAVIQKARSLRPDKPVRAVINTHHHFDHSSGVRAAMSEGLTIITHKDNLAFFENLARRRFTILPDALAKSPKLPLIETVSDRRTLSDETRRVEVFAIRGSLHSASMLIVYLPAERLLIEADLFTPPAATVTTPTPQPFAFNLIDNIGRLGLVVDRIVPIHGRVVPFLELQAAAVNTRN